MRKKKETCKRKKERNVNYLYNNFGNVLDLDEA